MPDKTPAKTPDAPPQLTEEQLECLVPTKIDNEVKMVPVKDLITGFQKGTAAEKRFAEAHELQKAASEALELKQELREAIEKRDLPKFQRVLRMAGMSAEDIAANFSAEDQGSHVQRGQQGRRASEGEEEGEGEGEEDPVAQALLILNQRVETLAKAFAEDKRGQQDAKKRSEVQMAVDKDPELSKLIEDAGDDEDRAWIRQVVQACVEEASQTIPKKERALATGLEKAKKRLLKIRKTAGSEESADFGPGAAAATLGQLHRTTGTPKKVSLLSPEYANSILNRLAKMRKK